ncbi:DUF1015 family protein [Bacteroidales bacterium]|nr:DUF1015 family protein [Bacteroidales bacterium]
MAIVKEIMAVRPANEIVNEFSCLPYDVFTEKEARQVAGEKAKSIIRITRPEVNFDGDKILDIDSLCRKSVEVYHDYKSRGYLEKDNEPGLFVYSQSVEGRTQIGLLGLVSVDEYLNGTIKKHELTREKKEAERVRYINALSAQVEPVFLTYQSNNDIDAWLKEVMKGTPYYDFKCEQEVEHKLWKVSDAKQLETVKSFFETQVDSFYIADGHHRAAAASKVALERRKILPGHTGDESYNYFLAVCFPDEHLEIMDYNRVIKGLNDFSKEEFLINVEQNFMVNQVDAKEYRPSHLHEIAMYLDGAWYSLVADEALYFEDDPVGSLDVSILTDLILSPFLGIDDLRKSDRIGFVGGVKGVGELARLVDSKEWTVAFAMYPTSIEQLLLVADSGEIMPPKSTWFEPKLRSGLVIHEFY